MAPFFATRAWTIILHLVTAEESDYLTTIHWSSVLISLPQWIRWTWTASVSQLLCLWSEPYIHDGNDKISQQNVLAWWNGDKTESAEETRRKQGQAFLLLESPNQNPQNRPNWLPQRYRYRCQCERWGWEGGGRLTKCPTCLLSVHVLDQRYNPLYGSVYGPLNGSSSKH